MFTQPKLSDYSCYGAYALAAVGYAMVSPDFYPLAGSPACVVGGDGADNSGGGGRQRVVESLVRTLGSLERRGSRVVGLCSNCSKSDVCFDSGSLQFDDDEHSLDNQSSQENSGIGGDFGVVSGELRSQPCSEGSEQSKLSDNVLNSESGDVIGVNTLRNRAWREEKKRKKKERKVLGIGRGSVVTKDSVRISLERKWQVENELAASRAERQLAILKASNVEDEVKRYTTKVKKHTESNMVAIEKTHATLVATGNVPGAVGFAETILSDGSISPDSSASMQEFRACQKKNLDLEAQCEENEKEKKKLLDILEKMGVSSDLIDAVDKQTFTDNTENGELLDQLYPEGQGYHIVSRNGKNKLKVGCDMGEVSASFEPPAVEDDEYARRWVTQYSFIDAYARFGSSDKDLCAEAEIGMSVLTKYRRLKKQLNM